MPGTKRKYARISPGTYIGKRKYIPRARGRSRGMRRKFGYRIPAHSFHRWITAFQSGTGTLVNVTDCVYDGTDSFITCTALAKTCQFCLGFQIRDIPNVTEFSTLFDSYMITKVMLQFKLVDNPDAPGNIGYTGVQKNNFYPTIWYVTDHDDNNNVSLAAIKEFERVRHRVLYPNKETNIVLRPTTLAQVFRSTTTTGYANNHKRQWLDMANPEIPHYGFKSVIDFEGVAPATAFLIKVNAKIFFKCKSVR